VTSGRRSAIGGRRLLGAYVAAVVLPVVATLLLSAAPGTLNLGSDVLVLLLVCVLTALAGGLGPALLAAVMCSALLNYCFTPPRGSFEIDDADNALTLVVFVAVAMLVSWAVDVAARRTHEAALASATAAGLEEVDRTRTALLAAVGHDLRTPLAAAKAAVSTLRSPDLDLTGADRQELLATAEESLDRLTGLIENLLDMSRLQAGAMAVHLRAVAVEDVLARALEDLRPSPQAVAVDLPPDLPDVEADPGLLERVLVNLLANALRHSPSDDPPRLRGLATGSGVDIVVADRGPGIPAADRDRAFLPFQRLGDTDNSTGVGLGLALSRGLTEAMGGTLVLGETDGGGVTLVVHLRSVPLREQLPQPGLRERAQHRPEGVGP
jgi:two-component system, OmpR family, sensor histidine kinase KdpD